MEPESRRLRAHPTLLPNWPLRGIHGIRSFGAIAAICPTVGVLSRFSLPAASAANQPLNLGRLFEDKRNRFQQGAMLGYIASHFGG
jgi:hypothetical protein